MNGGLDENGLVTMNQIYDLTEQQLRNISIKGKEQSSRSGHTSTLDHTGSKIIIIGGHNTKTGFLNTVDILSNVDDILENWNWGEFHEPSIHPKDRNDDDKNITLCGCGFYDPMYHLRHANDLNIYGEEKRAFEASFHKNSHYVNVIFTTEEDLKTSTRIRNENRYYHFYDNIPKEKIFPQVAYHTANRIGQSVFIFGGERATNKCTNQMFEVYHQNWFTHKKNYNITHQNVPYVCSTSRGFVFWKEIICKGEIPTPRSHHSSCIVNYSTMYIIGGKDGPLKMNDIYSFDYTTLIFKKITTSGTKLPAMYGHSTTAVGDKIFIFGGISVN